VEAVMRKSKIAIIIEDSIKEIADQFTIKDDKAFYFRNESDIQCRLFACISKNIGDVELVHAEQRIENSRSWHDLVIWKPEMKEKAPSHWSKVHSAFAEELPDINLCVIEIKHLYGGTSSVKEYMNCKSICSQPDIQNLISRVKGDCKYAYFVMFWDEHVKNDEDFNRCYNRMQTAFITLRKRHKRIRILCKTRDRLQFNPGF
jgi:hypothetical protein